MALLPPGYAYGVKWHNKQKKQCSKLEQCFSRFFKLATDAINGISNPMDSNSSVIEPWNQSFFKYLDSKYIGLNEC